MRCVHEIRANGVAPVPVADACQHSQQMTAESCLPPTHDASHFALTRVYSADEPSVDREVLGDVQRLPISLKTRRGVGAGPHSYRARCARSFS